MRTSAFRFGTPNGRILLFVDAPHRVFFSFPKRFRSVFRFSHCTVMLTVAVLLARLGSGVSSWSVAFSVITVPDGAVTFTVSRTVHVVFGAMALFSWQTISPVPS